MNASIPNEFIIYMRRATEILRAAKILTTTATFNCTITRADLFDLKTILNEQMRFVSE